MDRNQAERARLAATFDRAEAAWARAEAMARPERGPYQVEWEKTEIEKTKRLLARRRP